MPRGRLMLRWIRKYWGSLSFATVVNVPNLIQGIKWVWEHTKWVWDWLGRFDLVSNHMHDFQGLRPVITFFTNPAPWSIFPSVFVAAAVVAFDVRRQARKAFIGPSLPPDPNRKLAIAFYAGCVIVCVSVWYAAWHFAIPSTAPPAPVKPPIPAPMPVRPPSPPPQWLSQEEATQQQNKGRSLLIYSPQEIFAMLSAGQNINVFGDRWIKLAGPTSSLPIPEKIQGKDFYRIEFKLDGVQYDSGKVAAYFDPKKYGDVLISTRVGTQLKAVCQLTRVDSVHPYAAGTFFASVIAYTFVYSNCEPL